MPDQEKFIIFCGPGNNGGDGKVMGKMLEDRGQRVEIHGVGDKPQLPKDAVIIDALFGTGLSRPLEGEAVETVKYINNSGLDVISIDLPSGLTPLGDFAVKATHTLTFQCPKLAFFMSENEKYVGHVIILDIGLSDEYYNHTITRFETTGHAEAKLIKKERSRFAHKGTMGHAALVTGSYGMLGAAILAARACLHSGVGKLTCFMPEKAYPIMQVAVPEVVYQIDKNENIVTDFPADAKFQSLGIGPGWGIHEEQVNLLRRIFHADIPLVIDADALNLLAAHSSLLAQIPKDSILTPHPKEFERLFGKTEHDIDRIELAMQKAAELQVYIIVKGHRTLVATPAGVGYFNMSGNPGMATAGSGDVLTGILTGLLAQGYTALEVCLLGVFLHGLAGDLAVKLCGEDSMIASDIIDQIGNAYLQMSS
jgi:NAD(P)H-hydrate epimerase